MKKILSALMIVLIAIQIAPVLVSYSKETAGGPMNPALGFDKIVNGTTTFLVPRRQSIQLEPAYHNITETRLETQTVETSTSVPGARYDPSTLKYYYDRTVAKPYTVTVPDPSGQVTVFSNWICQNVGDVAHTENIVIPDGLSQAILYVVGQSNGDPWSRLLKITLNGQQVDSEVVTNSFSYSYTETSNVLQRTINTVGVSLGTWVGYWNVSCYFAVSTTGADVYIIKIPGVTKSYVNDTNAVARGVAQECMVTPMVHLNTWKPLTYLEITDMNSYKTIIENPASAMPPGFNAETGIIVVNAHGEVFPLPSGYTWQTWIDKISSQIQTGGLTWVQVAGWPFYYYSCGTGDSNTIGPAGFQRFMAPIAGSPNNINCNSQGTDGTNLGLTTDYNSKLLGYGLVSNGLTENRPIDIGISQPANQDDWTQTISCSAGFWWNWAMCGISVDTTRSTVGGASIKASCQNLDWGCLAFNFTAANGFDASAYPVLCFDIYLQSAFHDFYVFLKDVNGKTAGTSPLYSPLRNQFNSIAVRRSDLTAAAGFDWTKIKTIALSLDPNNVGDSGSFWVDHMFFDSGASTLCHSLSLMTNQTGTSTYLSLGLISFAAPNQNVTLGQTVGYYVHNGAGIGDSDFNKGKYSMATAAWIKISLLAENWFYILFYQGFGAIEGTCECKLFWSEAHCDSSSGKWTVNFVTTTLTGMLRHPVGDSQSYLADATALLRVTDPTQSPSTCTFAFQSDQSTMVKGEGDTTWQNVMGQVAEGAAWTAISVIAGFVVGPEVTAATVVTIALGGLQTGMDAALSAFRSSSGPIQSGGLVDLAMEDNSNLDTTDSYGTQWRQLQSIGVTKVTFPWNNGAGVSKTLNFEVGQKVFYNWGVLPEWTQWNTCNFTENLVIEPRQNNDANTPPQPAQMPTGPSTGYRYTSYTFSTYTIDPNGDDVCFTFYWGDDPTNKDATTTRYIESGNVSFASHQYASPGNYYIYVLAHDCDGATANANSGSHLIVIIDKPPNTPNPLSGSPPQYVYTYYSLSTFTTDPEGDNINYTYNWGDGSTWSSGWVANGTVVSPWHEWSVPSSYTVSVKAEDVYLQWSNLQNLSVAVGQNDASQGKDAGNNVSSAMTISPPGFYGTLYNDNTYKVYDQDDWYNFTVDTAGKEIDLSISSISSPAFTTTLELYKPSGGPPLQTNGPSSYPYVSWVTTVSGTYSMHLKLSNGEGQYYVSVFVGYNHGGCPVLSYYNGQEYQCEGLLPIHNPNGTDITTTKTLRGTPQPVNGVYLFKLTEDVQTISHIDQVKLYAVLQDGKTISLPLLYAWHSEYGNVLPQLLFADGVHTVEYGANHNNGVSQSIQLKFLALPSNAKIQYFIFQIKGCNTIVKN